MKKKKNKKNIRISDKKIKILMLSFFIVFFILIIRIGSLQFVQVNGSSLKELAYNQQTLSRLISPKRGTIYDSTGKVLATSATVDTISINPSKIPDKSKEKVSKALSEIFQLDYDETLEKVNSEKSVETIAKKVEQDKVTKLKEWMSDNNIAIGINIDEDTKRYYPYDNLASTLLGFCGNDNQGLYGIEAAWDNVLTGTPGKIVTSTDIHNDEISDKNQQYIEAENGSNLYLTIDASIQTILEKYVKQAVEENQCSRGGCGIIMEPKTGNILAMTTYPDYNLNTPFEPNTIELKNKWDTLDSKLKSETLENMWKNKAISEPYEPGSTFKVLVASIAIEENITGTDINSDFSCAGYEEINGIKIRCWSKESHGYQSLRQGLCNSCNPAFMQLGRRIGKETLYKYFDAFGLFNKTGIAISGEVSSNFHNINNVGPIELATISFGQRFKITPMQLITAVSAVANDGVLVQPRIVDKIVNSDTNTSRTTDVNEVRQVVSKETANKVKDMMESVVTDGTGKYGTIKGYSIGAKTGTSEPSPGNEEEGYTVSYVAISPAEDPEIVALVSFYDPGGSNPEGGKIAGPTMAQILSEVLPYLGMSSDTVTANTNPNNTPITVPDVANKTVTEAEKILKNAGFRVSSSVSGDKNTLLVTDQVPKAGISLRKDSLIVLYTAENTVRTSVNVPNLKGMNLSQAINSLKSKNLNISYDGNTSGTILTQDPSYTTSVEEGTVVKVVFTQETGDAH